MDESLKLAISLIGGAALGVLAKAWQIRTKISLLVTSIEFEHNKGSDSDEVKIPPDIQALSERSRWVDDLPATMLVSELRALVNDDLADTVTQLDELCDFLPRLLKETKSLEQMSDDAATSAYMHFFAKNASAQAMSYYTMNISGLLRREELDISELNEWLPAETKNPLDKGLLFPKGASKLDELLDVAKSLHSEGYAVNALKIATQWHPQLTKRAAETVLHQVSPQAPLNRKLFEALKGLLEGHGGVAASQSAIVLRAALANHGELPVSIDRYAALRLPGNLPPAFLVATTPADGYLTLTSGQTIQVAYRSRSELSSTVADSLKGLFNTKALSCQLITRIVTKRLFQRRWVKSELTTLSDLNAEVIEEYIEEARKTQLR